VPVVSFEAHIESTANRFARANGGSKSTFHYVASKLRRDPAMRAVLDLAPLGEVIDIGCGRGQLGILLLEAAAATKVLGLDWDKEKVEAAQAAAEDLPAKFETRDARGLDLESADSVLLIDVLHYLEKAAQDELLTTAASLVRPGGRLILREATTTLGWRSTLTIGIENISRFIRLNVGDRIVIRDVEKEIVPILESHAMTCEIKPCFAGTPFANVLLIAEKRPT
jgi:2-polyprenyl-3-methyl-5-hydroxy-6-metoxy-1,4-benzoquinol methylase